ncbi:hypothetical protein L873DRAFT_868931 [Choiromyces venosus 120613-1]|uniref:Uncharacterized protein n=1 Tax=Choiromyces venosus 120613-1 TaxID=1336337 RepID=A0A3N4JNV9_9PEZI|nr:hypothetical protein L873DRAFT_868931 [Choiromyces venosus 120613-1]
MIVGSNSTSRSKFARREFAQDFFKAGGIVNTEACDMCASANVSSHKVIPGARIFSPFLFRWWCYFPAVVVGGFVVCFVDYIFALGIVGSGIYVV